MGFEPATHALRKRCSTTELHRLITCLLSQSLTSISDATDYNPEASLMSSIFAVILSAAKSLAPRTERSFAALRMTARTPLKSAHGKSSLQMSSWNHSIADQVE